MASLNPGTGDNSTAKHTMVVRHFHEQDDHVHIFKDMIEQERNDQLSREISEINLQKELSKLVTEDDKKRCYRK